MPVICPKCGRENAQERYTCEYCRAPLPPQLPAETLQGVGGPAPPKPEAPPPDPGAGSLGAARAPERAPRRTWVPEPKPAVKKGRSAAVTGAIVGALIGAVGVTAFGLTWWLVNRDTRVPGAEMVFVATLLSWTTMGAAAGAVIGALSAAEGGGAITGAKVGAALAAFFGLLALAGLAVHEGSLAPIREQGWRAVVAVGAAAAFGGVIGAGAHAASDRWV